MSSQRLPGKVLRTIAGKPLLQYVLERLQRSRGLDAIVVCTSSDDSDTPIVEFCEAAGVVWQCGSLTNVASRYNDVLERHGFDGFARVCADSPLLDPGLLDHGIELLRTTGFDVVTNTLRRTYPRGQSVEVVRADAFRRAFRHMATAEDFEHVTRYFYQRQYDFRVWDFVAGADYGGVNLAVDTVEDLERCEAIVGAMDRPHWEYGLSEIMELYPWVTVGVAGGGLP